MIIESLRLGPSKTRSSDSPALPGIGINFNIFLDAARRVESELHRTPREFGESRDYLAELEFELRLAFVRPLEVAFAIHEATRTVYYRRIRLLDR